MSSLLVLLWCPVVPGDLISWCGAPDLMWCSWIVWLWPLQFCVVSHTTAWAKFETAMPWWCVGVEQRISFQWSVVLAMNTKPNYKHKQTKKKLKHNTNKQKTTIKQILTKKMSTMRTVLTFALSLRGSIVDYIHNKNARPIHNKQYKNNKQQTNKYYYIYIYILST